MMDQTLFEQELPQVTESSRESTTDNILMMKGKNEDAFMSKAMDEGMSFDATAEKNAKSPES